MYRYIFLFLATIVMAGCVASGPVYKSDEPVLDGTATLYIYRPNLFFNKLGWPNIYVGAEKLFSLKNNGYGVVRVPPGEHTILVKGSSLNWYPGPLEFTNEYEANKEYYIRVTPKQTSAVFYGDILAVSGDAAATVVPKEQALSEISETKRVY